MGESDMAIATAIYEGKKLSALQKQKEWLMELTGSPIRRGF
jgi:hypothetical protein